MFPFLFPFSCFHSCVSILVFPFLCVHDLSIIMDCCRSSAVYTQGKLYLCKVSVNCAKICKCFVRCLSTVIPSAFVYLSVANGVPVCLVLSAGHPDRLLAQQRSARGRSALMHSVHVYRHISKYSMVLCVHTT